MKCKLCGAEFTLNTGKQIYCSAQCRKTMEKRNDRKQYKETVEYRKPKQSQERNLDDVMAELKAKGIEYNDWKTRQAFSHVTPIILEVK